ncbi:MAG: aminotransferase class I and II, partial [Thermomicrobiaceae bacterium]|nr:aminotransferase class I and II [Thermomicrobiaceae bacterium]
DFPARARAPFPQIRDHVLLPHAAALAEVDADLGARLTPALIRHVVDLVPDAWLLDPAFPDLERHRDAYVTYLLDRLAPPRLFVEEAIDARAELL